MTDATREKAFGVAAVTAEILGWIALLGTSHVALGLILIVGGTLLWGNVPAVADTRPGRGFIVLGLQNIRDRVQGWDSRDNSEPDNNQMQPPAPSPRAERRG